MYRMKKGTSVLNCALEFKLNLEHIALLSTFLIRDHQKYFRRYIYSLCIYVSVKGGAQGPIFFLLVIRSVSDVLRAQSRFVKFVGGKAAGRTPYTFYKPTLGPKYVSNIPYNEFITPTTFV